MPNNDVVANAKKALDEANKMFPSPAKPKVAAAAPAAPAKPAAKPTIADELRVKQKNVDEYKQNVPAYRKGGHVGKAGGTVEEGETVLPKDNPKKSAELAMEHLGLEAGMHDGAKEKKAAKKKSAKKSSKKAGKHPRPTHTTMEHLASGGHIMKHRYAANKEDGLMPAESTHIAMDDQGMHDHMDSMMAGNGPTNAGPEAAPAAPEAAAAPPMPGA